MDEEVQNLVRMLEEMHAKWKVLDSKSYLFERMSLELLSGLRAVEWDLQDLEDTVSIVEGSRMQTQHDAREVLARKVFIEATRKQIVTIRKEVQGQSGEMGHRAITAERPPTKIQYPSFPHGRAPTQRDRLCFLAFRTMVGITALGLTAALMFTVAPLVVETAIEAPPAPPPTPWALWSDHDAEASRMILLISSMQATLIACFFLWYQFSSSTRKDEAAAKARRIDQRTRDRRKLLSRKASRGGSTGGAPREGDTGDGDADSSAIQEADYCGDSSAIPEADYCGHGQGAAVRHRDEMAEKLEKCDAVGACVLDAEEDELARHRIARANRVHLPPWTPSAIDHNNEPCRITLKRPAVESWTDGDATRKKDSSGKFDSH